MDPDVIGDQVATAVESGKFFLPTHDNVVDKLVARAGDWEGFIARQVVDVNQR